MEQICNDPGICILFALGEKKKNPLAAGASHEKRRQPSDGVFLLLAVPERYMLVRPFSRIAVLSLFYPIPRYIELKQNPNLSCARYLAMVPQTFLCVRLLLGKDK